MNRVRIRIVADELVPYLKDVPGSCVDIVFRDGASICRDDLAGADALIVRTRTRCDSGLLEGTGVRFIASATIGLDHIDLPWCASHGIKVCNSAGCNAGAVMQYVFTALYGVAAQKSLDLEGRTIGIIGVGNVGRRVEKAARRLGFKTLLCDPPRASREGSEGFVPLEELLHRSDIVTLHTPLDGSTRGMADRAFFSLMRPGSVFINASRGEVVDENALKEAREKLGALIIDTWAGEPAVDAELLEMTDVATPHIAGYSLLGKINGTEMAVRALAEHFGIGELRTFRIPAEDSEVLEYLSTEDLTQQCIADRLLGVYDIFKDDRALRSNPGSFENLRRHYRLRKEIKFI